MRTRIVITIIFLIGAALSLCLVYQVKLTSETSGVLANLGTGFIGTAFTVLIVDWLYERREMANALPKRCVAYEDVRLLVARTIGFWYTAYMESVPGELPKSVAALVAKESIAKIYQNLDMNSSPNATPRCTWWDYLPARLGDLRNLSETILHRHSAILDPDAYILVNELAHKALDPNHSITQRMSDREYSFPRPQVLDQYIAKTDEYFPSLLKLMYWCNSEADKIKRLSGVEVQKIDENLRGIRKEGGGALHDCPRRSGESITSFKRISRETLKKITARVFFWNYAQNDFLAPHTHRPAVQTSAPLSFTSVVSLRFARGY